MAPLSMQMLMNACGPMCDDKSMVQSCQVTPQPTEDLQYQQMSMPAQQPITACDVQADMEAELAAALDVALDTKPVTRWGTLKHAGDCMAGYVSVWCICAHVIRTQAALDKLSTFKASQHKAPLACIG